MKTIIVGASGFVASAVLKSSDYNTNSILTPPSQELDITIPSAIDAYLKNTPAGIVLNFAAFTNVREAEAQREKTAGRAWKVNVVGAKNLASVCKKFNRYLVHISTDAVFPAEGTCGPFAEDSETSYRPERVSWYGYTKSAGEKAVKTSGGRYAIVRIAYPFFDPLNPKDYLFKLAQATKAGYPLFSDQQLTPTYLPDLKKALDVLVKHQYTGIYHVATTKLTTPYQIGQKIAELTKTAPPKKGSLIQYHKDKKGLIPYALFGGLKSEYTQRELGIKFHSWEKAVEKVFISGKVIDIISKQADAKSTLSRYRKT